jgi:hypothetical protein
MLNSAVATTNPSKPTVGSGDQRDVYSEHAAETSETNIKSHNSLHLRTSHQVQYDDEKLRAPGRRFPPAGSFTLLEGFLRPLCDYESGRALAIRNVKSDRVQHFPGCAVPVL